jgi:hypothetical protein
MVNDMFNVFLSFVPHITGGRKSEKLQHAFATFGHVERGASSNTDDLSLDAVGLFFYFFAIFNTCVHIDG